MTLLSVQVDVDDADRRLSSQYIQSAYSGLSDYENFRSECFHRWDRIANRKTTDMEARLALGIDDVEEEEEPEEAEEVATTPESNEAEDTTEDNKSTSPMEEFLKAAREGRINSADIVEESEEDDTSEESEFDDIDEDFEDEDDDSEDEDDASEDEDDDSDTSEDDEFDDLDSDTEEDESGIISGEETKVESPSEPVEATIEEPQQVPVEEPKIVYMSDIETPSKAAEPKEDKVVSKAPAHVTKKSHKHAHVKTHDVYAKTSNSAPIDIDSDIFAGPSLEGYSEKSTLATGVRHVGSRVHEPIIEYRAGLPGTIQEYILSNGETSMSDILKLYPRKQLNRELNKGSIYRTGSMIGA